MHMRWSKSWGMCSMASMCFVKGRDEITLSFMGARRGKACSGLTDFTALLSR